MDPIADMINRIRVALIAKKEIVEVPSSRIKKELARVLKEQGYIANYKVFDNDKSGVLKILLRYTSDKEPAISHIERISRLSARRYAGYRQIKASTAFGVNIVSTPKGIVTDKQAKSLKVGGELLARVW